MQDHESIKDMFPRFTTIVNDLNTLGEKYTTHQGIKKILRSLPNIWRPKVISITKAKDLKILAMDEVIGLLNVHEQELIGELQLPNGKAITLKASRS